jgi:hypothetical protein
MKKRMKRFLAVFFVLTLVMSNVGTVFASEAQENRAQMLESVGVTEGDGDSENGSDGVWGGVQMFPFCRGLRKRNPNIPKT